MITKRAVDWKAIGQTLLTPEVLGAIVGGAGAPLATYLVRRKKEMPLLQRIAELLGAGVLGAGAGAGIGYGGKKGLAALMKLFEKAPEAAKTQTTAGAAAKTEKAKPVTKEEPVPPPHPYYPGLPFGESEEEVLSRFTGADEADEQAIRDALNVLREQTAGLAGAASPAAHVDQLIADMAAKGSPPLSGLTGESSVQAYYDRLNEALEEKGGPGSAAGTRGLTDVLRAAAKDVKARAKDLGERGKKELRTLVERAGKKLRPLTERINKAVQEAEEARQRELELPPDWFFHTGPTP
jgi:hypothetical protein